MIDNLFPCDIGAFATIPLLLKASGSCSQLGVNRGDHYEAQDHRDYQYISPRAAGSTPAREALEMLKAFGMKET